MGFLDNAVNKSVPQGSSLAKPLLLAFGALLASGALTGALTRKQAPTPAPGTSPAADPQAGGLLGGLGGLLEKFQQSGHGDVAKSWVGSGQNQPISPGQQLGARSVTYQDLGRKDGYVRTGRDCATVEYSASFC